MHKGERVLLLNNLPNLINNNNNNKRLGSAQIAARF